ncbi:hypothetical protein [Photobacterium leiognathi]|uniref:hypothetical protein n=1 Tax=Photobacterium leiognathi TaxID=553611 RepID=UPI0029819877|nr:hypothetical protein [Photobacterium leiognathi]
MTNSSIPNTVFEVDFSTMPDVTLFTGRKNGRKARQHFGIRASEEFSFIANDDQVITSSYFLGLIGDELAALLKKPGSNNIKLLLEHVHTDRLNLVSQNECIRAIKRGLSPQDDVLL